MPSVKEAASQLPQAESACTVAPPCKDTRCKYVPNVRTKQLATNYWVLTARVPLSTDNLT